MGQVPDLCHDCATLVTGNCTRPESVTLCLLQGVSPHFLHPPLWPAPGWHPWLQQVLETRAMSMWRMSDKNPFRHTPFPKLWLLCVQWGTQVAQHGEVTSLRQRPSQYHPQKEKALLANPHHFCTSKSSGQMEARTKIQVKTSSPKPFAFRSKFHMF